MYECGGGGGVVMHKVNNMLYIHTKRRILKISRIWEGTTFVFVVHWIFTWFLYEFMMKPVSSSCSLFSSVLSCRRKEKKTEKEFCWLWQETRMTRTGDTMWCVDDDSYADDDVDKLIRTKKYRACITQIRHNWVVCVCILYPLKKLMIMSRVDNL